MYTKAVLKNEDKNGLSSVYIQYNHDGKTKRFPTGIKVPKSYWNEEKQVIKQRGTDNFKEDNFNLTESKRKIDKIIKDFIAESSRYPSCLEVEDIYEAQIKPKEDKTLDDYFGEFIQRKEIELSPNTIKSFNQVRRNLNEFAEVSRIKLDFKNIDTLFFENFKAYYIKKRHRNTTISKRLKVLKEFLNDGLRMKIHNNPITKEYMVKLPKHKNKQVITLSIDELEGLKSLDLSKNRRLERIRDLFILQSWTGLRYSDIIRLQKHNIINDKIIVDSQKTKSNCELPLFPEAKLILEKYDYVIKKISNDKYNEYLKEVCKLLPDLQKPLLKIDYCGNTQIKTTKPKWEFIGTHTARRNFITLLIDMGVNIPQIMKWSNHSTLAMFQEYMNNKQAEESEVGKVIQEYTKRVKALN